MGCDAASDGPGCSRDATSEQQFRPGATSDLVFVLTHVVAEAGEPHRTISNHDLAVAPGIDSFGVEFVHYAFISFAMI
jgi:hypothetical protein